MKPISFNWQAGQSDNPAPQQDLSLPLRRNQTVAVAFSMKDSGQDVSEELSPTLRAMAMQVRRLTPRECERLQGFPDDYTLIPTKVKRLTPPGSGPCAKQTVTAMIVAQNGTHFVATNHCLSPQPTCARAGMPTGVGYELCKSVCQQPAHAEINVIRFAGKHARGGTLYLSGHTYVCDECQAVAREAGVVSIVVPAVPEGNAADGPRYKAIGNSWAVPVVRWIGERIEKALL